MRAGTRPAPALTMAVASTTGSARARITALSGSGRVFCIRATADDRVTWGAGGAAGVVGTRRSARPSARRWRTAATRPGPRPPSRRPPGGSCAVASDSDYVMCRAVEAEIVRILATAKPA